MRIQRTADGYTITGVTPSGLAYDWRFDRRGALMHGTELPADEHDVVLDQCRDPLNILTRALNR